MIRPKGKSFLADKSPNTIAKREAQVAYLLEARRSGKYAFFVMDKLIVKDMPPDSSSVRSNTSDNEISFNIS